MDLVVGDDILLAERLVTAIRAVLPASSTSRGWSVAIPGGSVATRLLPHLARSSLPWVHAHVFFVDERCVPPSDVESNWRLCREATHSTPLASATWHRLEGDRSDPRSAAHDYTNLLHRHLGAPPILDVVLLGAGEDGHVASIFPGRTLQHSTEAEIAVEWRAPKPPPVRLTMTPPLLTTARLTCVAAFGEAKREAMRAIFDASSSLPVAEVMRSARQALVLTDPAAAPRPR